MMPQNEGALSAVLLLAATLAILGRGVLDSSLCAGASILSNPSSSLALALLGIRRGKRFLAFGAGLTLAVCSPWILRNWAELGAPYFIRDNFGLEVYLGNNDEAQPEMVTNLTLWRLHPTYNREEAALVLAQGEGPYNRAKLASALDWMRGHVARFLQLCAARAFYYWFPSGREGWPAYGYRLVSALAILGVWLSRKNRVAMWLAAAAVVYSAPFILIQSDVKYGFPMLWASALPAGYAINAGCRRWLPDSNN
jgi:hypothetical protein